MERENSLSRYSSVLGLPAFAAREEGGPSAGGQQPDQAILTDIILLARLIYAEAGVVYNVKDAMEGVGATVRNRVRSRGYPKSYSGVIFQRGKDGKYEYRAVGSRRWQEASRPHDLKGSEAAAYARALAVAEGIFYGRIPDPTKGAIMFHSQKKIPRGFLKLRIEESEQIGPFTFYREVR